jgi:hypothetical protein
MPLESMCGAPGCWRHVREDPENSEVLVIPVWRGGGGANYRESSLERSPSRGDGDHFVYFFISWGK